MRLFIVPLLAAAVLASNAVQAQPTGAGLVIVQASGQISIESSRLLDLPRVAFDATARGKSAKYEGTDLTQILRLAGLDVNAPSHGASTLRKVISVHAADGYVVAFALPELDPSIGNKQVYLVNRQDGAPLEPKDGPWRLVIPSETRPTRWLRQVERIVVADAP